MLAKDDFNWKILEDDTYVTSGAEDEFIDKFFKTLSIMLIVSLVLLFGLTLNLKDRVTIKSDREVAEESIRSILESDYKYYLYNDSSHKILMKLCKTEEIFYFTPFGTVIYLDSDPKNSFNKIRYKCVRENNKFNITITD